MFTRSHSSPLCRLTSLVLSAAAFAVTGSLAAQSPAVASLKPLAQLNRVAAHPDLGPQQQLTGHLPAWVSGGTPLAKPVDTSEPLQVTVVLQRDATVQAAFEKLLADQQTPGSPFYHQWLTPQQVGKLYGPTDADLAQVTSWLTAQGLTVDLVANSHVLLEVHGTASAIASAFRTNFAYYNLNGVARLSAATEPSIPAALAPVVKAINGLTEVPVNPTTVTSAPHKPDTLPSTTNPHPNMTLSGGTHYVTPGDFAIIYDVNSVYTGGNKGATLGSKANHVAIIGRSRVSATDISEWAANVGISGYNLNYVIPTTGTDPGAVCTFANASTCSTGGDQGEQTLDVIRVIGTAPAVQADLVVSLSSRTTDGVYLAAAYNVNTTVDPVMTISYGSCETSNGASGVATWDTLFSAGAAEGISTFVSAGDSGANGCATSFTATTTSRAASINAICSSSYATCVGGTQFADTASPSTYWAAYVSGGNNFTTALSYIPEGVWNEPEGGGTVAATDCSGGTYCPSGTGGGVSVYIAKPTWQTGTGVPAGSFRYVPDMSYPAASHDGFYACLDFELGLYASQGITSADNCTSAGGGYFFGFGGTSAAAPTMAGVAALLNTKAGIAQGNLNPLFYTIGAGSSASTVYHDITVASSGVGTCDVTVPSMCNNSTPGKTANSTSATGGVVGYAATTGYDEATGWGSIDVAKFLTAAITSAPAATTTTLTLTPATITLGTSTVLKATVSNTAATGNVIFYSNGTALNGAGTALSSGVASFTYTPTATGTFPITATYAGDSNYATSTTTAPSTLTVNAAVGTPTTTTLLLTPSTVIVGSASMLKATVSSTSAAGTVTFSITPPTGTITTIGPVTLASGVALGSFTPSAVGNYTITASFATSNTSYASSSTTAASTLTVLAPFTVTSAATTLSFQGGATTGNTMGITVTGATGFTSAVNLTCLVTVVGNTAPVSPATCAVAPTSVTGSGAATLTITSIKTTQQAAHTGPTTAGSASTWGFGALLLAMAGMLLPAGRRRSLRALRVLPVLALFGIAAAMVTGCGKGGTTISTPTTPVYVGSFGSYTVTVTGTSTTPAYTSTTPTIQLTITQ